VDTPTHAFNSLRHTRQVFNGMELTLFGKQKRRTGVVTGNRRGVYKTNPSESGSVRRIAFAFEILNVTAGSQKQVTVQSRKIAIDFLFGYDLLDTIDGGLVTLRGQAGTGLTVQTLKIRESVIESEAQVRSRTSSLATCNRSVVDDNDREAIFCQQVSGSHTGNSGAYDTHVCLRIACNGVTYWDIGRSGPDRIGLTGIAFHVHPHRCR
jgi:hypothetical protein